MNATPQTREEKEDYIKRLMLVRQRCRTDIFYLCQNVLGYKDIHPAVHQPIADKLVKFKGGVDDYDIESGILKSYTPYVLNPYDLEGKRRHLYLDPRGFLKTTLITVAHKIQWILNYPDIRILICHAIGEMAKEILGEMKSHFQYNNVFRDLFREYCPSPKKASDWGNQEQFVVMNRVNRKLKEPTVKVSSIESTTAGDHQEVIICSDIVDKENVRTPDRIRQIKSSFSQLHFLLDEPARAFLDVEGTCYDFSDLYNVIMDAELKKKDEERIWEIHRRGITDSDGQPIWGTPAPGRTKCFPMSAIEMIRNDPNMDNATFSAQYHNVCLAGTDQLFVLEEFRFVPLEVIKSFCTRFHATVDLATIDPIAGKKGTEDFTVITVAGFDQMNRMYVSDIRRGRFKPSETIDQIFAVQDKWGLQDVKIEDAAGARTLFPMLDRERVKRNKWPVLSLIKRDSRVTKQERIAGLQPWFRAGDIRFYEGIPWKDELLAEMTRFPRYSHDDIADSLADHMQNRITLPYKREDIAPEKKLPWYIDQDEDLDAAFDLGENLVGV